MIHSLSILLDGLEQKSNWRINSGEFRFINDNIVIKIVKGV